MGGISSKMGKVHLEKGKKLPIKITFGTIGRGRIREAQLIWASADMTPSPAAVAAAKAADVVVAVVGITSELEGEEMPVSEEGFPGRRPHEPGSSQAGAGAAGSCDGGGQADGGGADERERAGRELGE